MNYYNPYFTPYTTMSTNTGLFSRLFGRKLNFSSILSGTSKVVNFANQAIPLVKQVGPLVNNAKTMFRVMNEFKKVEIPTTESISVTEEKKEADITSYTSNNDGPTFFL